MKEEHDALLRQYLSDFGRSVILAEECQQMFIKAQERVSTLEKRMEQAAEEISGWMTCCDYRAEPYLQKAFRLLVEEET